MEHLNHHLLPGEKIYGSITGFFEEMELGGIHYKYGELTATTHRLMLEAPCFFAAERICTYEYRDVAGVKADEAIIMFYNQRYLKLKWLQRGEAKHFLKIVRLKGIEAGAIVGGA
ncbi:hypothetical protein [Paenibacillus caui]|uniref:hypothetical protein n=1 Tax=Paenibacillus caui TaxID=2873927 RepID=UPI001CA84BF9|nr:hypothetical protein [Paenibacillus caui]